VPLKRTAVCISLRCSAARISGATRSRFSARSTRESYQDGAEHGEAGTVTFSSYQAPPQQKPKQQQDVQENQEVEKPHQKHPMTIRVFVALLLLSLFSHVMGLTLDEEKKYGREIYFEIVKSSSSLMTRTRASISVRWAEDWTKLPKSRFPCGSP